MKEKEKQLFKALCKFKERAVTQDLTEAATPAVLGHLFFNRVAGIAYGVLEKYGILGMVNREFRNSLKAAYEQNAEKNHSFLQCVSTVSKILAEPGLKVAMLKGAYLCFHYPDGYRTSNDIDLLVLPENVTTVGDLLYKEGFRQGDIRNGKFIPATRRDIIESKMMRGETVPYIKEINLPYMQFLEVDINFSMDYKNGDTDLLSNMLSRISTVKEKDISVPTLEKSDFFLHLCAHLYKEATTLPWIKMHRDMTIYKYCDIYMLLCEMTEKEIEKVFERARELKIEKICAYAVLEVMELFNVENKYAFGNSEEILRDDPDFRFRVISPKEKKTFAYQTTDVTKRFFTENRINDLREVTLNENT